MSVYIDRARAALESLSARDIVECYAERFVFEDPQANERITERQTLAAYFQALFALPGVRFTNICAFEAERWAAVEWTWHGRTRSGEAFAIRGASVMELEEGKIARETIYYDASPLTKDA